MSLPGCRVTVPSRRSWLVVLLYLAFSQSQEDPTCDPKCQNGGECKLGFGPNETEMGCICPAGMTGTYCELDEEAVCDLDCQNGGACDFEAEAGEGDLLAFVCLCPEGTSGDLCEIWNTTGSPSLPCGLQCRNGGKCQHGEKEGTFRCECPPGTGGGLCEITLDASENATQVPCDKECFNGGECELIVEDETEDALIPSCLCPPKTSGDQCEAMVEEMDESANSQSQAPSSAPAASEWPSSDTSTNAADARTEAPTSTLVCDPECQNGGNCRFVPGSSTDKQCICLPGASGDFCQNTILEKDKSTEAPSKLPCDLNCRNGGICDPGMGRPPSCMCPSGTAGDLCETVVGENCGVETCYHGSDCVRSSDGKLYCDCSTINEPGKHYAGQFCQYEATNYCGDGENYFCVNGGMCRDEGSGTFSCDCPEEWTGPSCEFESQNSNYEYKDCTLTCRNGGQCRKGGKDFEDFEDGLSEELEHLANEQHGVYAEHCVCPYGFTGKKCEHEYEECGKGEHMCLHGTKCVPPKSKQNPKWTCDCDSKSGKYCQRHQSMECSADSAGSNVYRGMTSLITCVNDGVCTTYQQNGKRFPACLCPEPYTGPHCELLKPAEQRDTPNIKMEEESAVSMFILFILAILLAVVLLFWYVRTRHQSSREKTATIRAAHIEEEGTKSSKMEEVDFEGVMEDVELL